MICIFFAGQMFIFIGDSGNFGKMVILAKFYDGNGFAELLNFSHMIAPEVMYLKNGGFLAGFWLTGYDLKSSTVQELEHLSEMMALAIGQVDVSCCIHFEFFMGEDHNYPSAIFMRLLQNLPTQNVLLSFSRSRGILNPFRLFSLLTSLRHFQRIKKFLFVSDNENKDIIIEKQIERFDKVIRA